MKNILFVLLLLIATVSVSQNKEEKLSIFIDKILSTAPQIPGISVVVVNTDSIIFTKGFGFADVENNIPATSEAGFYIASTTKPFVALLASVLEQKGMIDFNRSITEYAPFKNFKDNSVFKGVTIHKLLTHQGGIDNPFLSLKLAYSGEYTREEILNLVEKYTTTNKEGEIFEYTNLGYYLLSILLKEELGLDWRDLLKEYIFQPLNMNHTTAYISVAEKNALAMPYNGILSEKPERAYLMKKDDTMHAAGGIVSSADDMANWLMFQLNLGQVNHSQLYPKELLLKTHEQQVTNDHNFSDVFEGKGYSLGWRTGTYKGTPLVYHFGGYTGFFAHLSFLPEKKLAVAVFVNHELGSVPGNLIAEYAYDLFMNNTAALKKHEQYASSKFPGVVKKRQNDELKSIAQFAKRQWQLSLPKKSYEGVYSNAELGTVTVKVEQENLIVSFGHMRAIATPIEMQDVIRLELIPGDGIAVQFILENQSVKEIRYNRMSFIKQ